MFQKSEQINELACALAKAQGALAPAVATSENPYFKSKYADLTAVWQACREALSSNGLSVIQIGDCSADEMGLVTILAHSSGQWISGRLAIKLDKPTAQSMGSALSYFRRYGLSAIVGISQEDDDGNQVSQPKPRVSETHVMAAPQQSYNPVDDFPYGANFDDLPASAPQHEQSTIEELAPLAERKMNIGKHTGKTFHEIAASDANWGYAKWVDEAIKKNLKEKKNPNEAFLLYRDYAKSCGAPL